jgi:putative endonuclease
MSQQLGFAAEEHARKYLGEQGLTWLESNYRCRLGEIDLIMRDKEYLVFVEVRARTSKAYGGAVESVTQSKRQKLLRTATLYLQTKKLYDKQPCRFDVLSLDGVLPQITWIKNAFGLDY